MTSAASPVHPNLRVDLSTAVWCCPQCKGALDKSGADSWECTACLSVYPVFDGIPDLRLPGLSWIDYEEDRAMARKFIAASAGLSLEEQLAWCFAARKDLSEEQIRVRVRQVVKSVDYLTEQFDDWLCASISKEDFALDLGCGPGQLIAAASKRGVAMLGIDVRLLWLLAAKRLITAHGGIPVLAAALAEQMPIADETLRSVVSLDVIEHVADVPAYLKEIDRVTKRGGVMALSTPNRYSLAAEPHVGVWGVGWVPRRWQVRYVMWCKRIDYPFTCLLSVRESIRMIKKHTRFTPHVLVPKVAPHEIARFPAYRRLLAKIYNALAPAPMFRVPLLAVGPFFRIIAKK